MTKRVNVQKRIDPDPFGIVVSVAGILGGVAGISSLYDRYFPRLPSKTKLILNKYRDELKDEIKHINTNLEIIQEILKYSHFPHTTALIPISGVMQYPSDFDRYVKATDNIMRHLKRALKLTHNIEKQTFKLPFDVELEETNHILYVRETVQDIINNKDRHMVESIGELSNLLKYLTKIVDGAESNNNFRTR